MNAKGELIPEMSEGKHSNIGVIFAVGFSLMMAQDVALGYGRLFHILNPAINDGIYYIHI